MEISIIGGGITGLTTALALHKKGIEAIVFERAETYSEVGAALWLQPNAIKVLEWLGIKETVQSRGKTLGLMEVTDQHFKPFKAINGEILKDASGNQTLAIHRVELQRILTEEVEEKCKIIRNAPFQSFENPSDQITFQAGGENYQSDVLLGCDGIHSTVRAQLFPESELRSTHQICWRGISDYSLPGQLADKGKEMWGNRIRFGLSPIAGGKVYWFAVMNAKEGVENLTIDEVKAIFGPMNPIVADIIAATEFLHEAVLHDLKRLPTWHQGKVCLLGDAAHATTPNMGQGACQGMEDAYYFAHILAQSASPEAAFEAFEKHRRPKVDYVVNNSWRFGKIAHAFGGKTLMKTIMKLTPESVLRKQMGNLYKIEDFVE